MKTGDEVVIIWAVIPKSEYHKVSLPGGSHAKAVEIGTIEQLVQRQECMKWGSMMGLAVQRLAKKLCPEIAESRLTRLPPGSEYNI